MIGGMDRIGYRRRYSVDDATFARVPRLHGCHDVMEGRHRAV